MGNIRQRNVVGSISFSRMNVCLCVFCLGGWFFSFASFRFCQNSQNRLAVPKKKEKDYSTQTTTMTATTFLDSAKGFSFVSPFSSSSICDHLEITSQHSMHVWRANTWI